MHRYRVLFLLPFLLIAALVASEPAATAPPATPTDPLLALVEQARSGQTTAVTDLRFALGKAKPDQLVTLLNALAQQGNPQDAQVAGWYLDHADQEVLIAAITATGRLGIDSPTTVDHLARLLTHPLPLIQDVTLSSIAQLHDDRCLPRLIPLLDAGEPALARKAYSILQQQTGEKLPAERAAWQGWYDARAGDENARYEQCLKELATQEPRRMVEAIHGLAGLVTLRSRALAAMAPLAQHADAGVRSTVDAYLHQLTGTPADQPVTACLQRIHVTVSAAAAPPEPEPAAALATIQPPSYMRGFLDTWKGMFTIVAVLCFSLVATVFFLRTPAGQAVKHATGRFVNKARNTKVVVMIEEGTRRMVRPVAKPIKAITRRISNDANRAMRKVEVATRRMVRGNGKNAPTSSSDHAALERKETKT